MLFASLCCSSATQPWPRARPYSALSESPSTRITGAVVGAEGAAMAPLQAETASAVNSQRRVALSMGFNFMLSISI
ncbi:hypothetical protein D3C71_2032460 [compost metagenome]